MRSKICFICGNAFLKPKYLSLANWSKRKFCSLKCSGKFKCKEILLNCSYCGIKHPTKAGDLNRKKRTFCSRGCYAKFRKELLPFTEQNSYKGIRKEGENKQVYHRNYCQNNPDNVAHLKARRYAREKSAEGSHTLLEWNQLKEKHNNKCAHCKEEKKLTKDHIHPLSKGGSDYIGNIQPLCRNCNSKKWQNKELTNQ